MPAARPDLGAGMELSTAMDFASSTNRSVLTTLRRNGRPQLSNVMHHAGEDGLIRISTTATRAKYPNLRRTPWAALHVSPDFQAYVVLEGDVTLSAVAVAEDDPAVDELVVLYRNLLGEHPDWADYRRSMVADSRVVVRIRPTRAYGMLRLPEES
jgi:PPOX class probable F420-dependent enzyme